MPVTIPLPPSKNDHHHSLNELWSFILDNPRDMHPVLARVLGYPASIWVATETPAPVRRWNGQWTELPDVEQFQPEAHLKPRFSELVLHAAEPHFRKIKTLAPITYSSFDCITIWYIHKSCSFACSFTCYSPMCDLINFHSVTWKPAHLPVLFHSESMNIDQIANWRKAGERAFTTAPCTYISDCDTIRTEILNWNQSSEFAKLWSQLKNYGFCAVWVLDGVSPVASVPVQFQPGPWTEPQL